MKQSTNHLVKRNVLGMLAVLLVSSMPLVAQATDMDAISPHPLGERSIYSDRATNARLDPVGAVCVEGQKCDIKTVASASSAGDSAASAGLTPKQVFDKHCATCHKTGVAGAPVFGNADDWAPHIAKGEKTLYDSALHGFKAMPPRGTCSECTDAEIKATVRYMVNHSGGDFKAPAKPASAPASTPSPTVAAAQPASSGMTPKEVFDKHCSMCHKTGVAGAPVFGNADDWAPHIAKGKKTLYHSAIHGFKAMPPRGTCTECTDEDLKATVRYMVNHSGGDFSK